MSDPILKVDDLSVAFLSDGAWRPVVEGVSFDVKPRETLAVVGESGSGKSVTSLAVLRLLPPKTTRVTGSVMLEGRPLQNASNAEIRAIRGNAVAMIFQEPMTSLNPVRTIGDQIAEPLLIHSGVGRREAMAEAVRLLDRVRIPRATARVGDYPHQFSGGMRQRVMIAMALACRPRLLIADEPTTALDVTIQAQILTLLKELQDEFGMSLMFITHDMGVVAEIADRVVVMNRGRVIEQGAVSTLFEAPREPWTRALLSAVPQLGEMAGRPRPMRFAAVDDTGVPAQPQETADTVRRNVPPIVEVRHLTTRFDVRRGILGRVDERVHAVEDVSFTLQPGETLALVGESGCGKSTIARSITGLVRPTSGEILIDGNDVLASRAARETARADAQMVFQDPFASLNPRMSVGTAIAEPMRLHRRFGEGEIRDRVASLLERVGLDPAMTRRFPHEFSGGQRQRICIARALALEPKLVIADESVSALDVSVKAQVINLLLDLQESLGLAYLFITHDMAVVERVSHRVSVMYAGEIVEIGPRKRIFENPQHPYTRTLLAAVPIPAPSRRNPRPLRDTTEPPSPVRPKHYQPPQRRYRTVAPDHLVLDPEPAPLG